MAEGNVENALIVLNLHCKILSWITYTVHETITRLLKSVWCAMRALCFDAYNARTIRCFTRPQISDFYLEFKTEAHVQCTNVFIFSWD